MKTLNGNLINLRALEPEDLKFLHEVENDESNWAVSHTQAPFSIFLLKQYLENVHLDIYETKQLRLVIEEQVSQKPVGLIDIFDFNPQHLRAGIGIIVHPEYQKKGYALESLQLLINYSFTHLNLHQLYANVKADNMKSLALFKKAEFAEVGVKKEWIYHNKTFKDEVLFQLINQ